MLWSNLTLVSLAFTPGSPASSLADPSGQRWPHPLLQHPGRGDAKPRCKAGNHLCAAPAGGESRAKICLRSQNTYNNRGCLSKTAAPSVGSNPSFSFWYGCICELLLVTKSHQEQHTDKRQETEQFKGLQWENLLELSPRCVLFPLLLERTSLLSPFAAVSVCELHL